MGDRMQKIFTLTVILTLTVTFVPYKHSIAIGCDTSFTYFDTGNTMYSECNLLNDSGKPTVEAEITWTPSVPPNPDPDYLAIINDEKVALLNRNNMKVRWEKEIPGKKMPISGDYYGIYVPTDSGFYGFQRYEGNNVWKSDFVPTCPPLLYESRLVFCNTDNRLIQIQTGAGSYEWSLDIDCHLATPCLVDEWIFCISKNGDIHKVSERGLDKIIGNMPNITSKVLVASGTNLFLHDKEGHIFSYNTVTSNINWIAKCESEPYQLAVGNGVLCVLTTSGCVYGISEKKGNTLWENQLSDTLGIFMTLDKVVVTTKNGIYVNWASTGKPYWKNDIKCVTNCSFDDGEIIFQTANTIGILGKPEAPVVELGHYAIDAGFIGLGEEKLIETNIAVNENIGDNFSVTCDKELIELEVWPHSDKLSTNITLYITIIAPKQPDVIDTKIVFSCQYGQYEIPVHFYYAKDKEIPWVMFKGTKDRKGESEAKTDIEKPKLLWSYQGGSAAESSCAIYEGRVYVGFYDGKMICLDLETGKKVWEFKAKGSVYSSPLAFCGRVYFGSWDKNIYCLDAKTGKVMWTLTTEGEVWSSPLEVNGAIYIGSDDGNLYCINGANGKLLKKIRADSPIRSSPAYSSQIVFATTGGAVRGISKNTILYPEWTYETGEYINSTPCLAYSKVFFGTWGKKVIALKNDGQFFWTQNTQEYVESSPSASKGAIYIGSNDFNFYCFDSQSGRQVWKFRCEERKITSSAAIDADNKIFVGT
jgi:outer membrane protein assembly factor BamB